MLLALMIFIKNSKSKRTSLGHKTSSNLIKQVSDFGLLVRRLLGLFWGPFSSKNGINVWTQFLKGSWWLPEAILGGFLGVFGAVSGGLVFQKLKKLYKTTLAQIVSFRYLSYSRRRLGAILAHVGEFWTSKCIPKINKQGSEKGCDVGFSLEPSLTPKQALKPPQNCPENRITKAPPSRGSKIA